MELISIILFLVGFWSFFSEHKYLTLIVIAFLSTDYLGVADPSFFLGSISLQHGDLALLLIFSLLPFRKKIKDVQINNIKRALFVFALFLAVSIFYDFFVRGTTAMQIFRTTRKTGYLAFLFLINSFSKRDYKNFIYFFIFLTAVHAILYISQYIFNYSFSPTETVDDEFGNVRYRNTPPLVVPMLVISVFVISKARKKIAITSLFFITIILAQSRGGIIASVSILLLFLFFQYKLKSRTIVFVFSFLFLGYLIIPYLFPIIGARFQSLFGDISLVGQADYGNLNFFRSQGSLIFRLGLTYERLMYVLADTTRIILGVGYIPDFDITHPIFILGTLSPALPTGFEQFNSVDIFFPNIITRYGIVGSIIFLYFIFKIFVFGYKNRAVLWGKILFTYLFSMIFMSLVNETFYNGQYFLIIFIMMGMIIKTKLLEQTNK